jgi:hypothetical protein
MPEPLPIEAEEERVLDSKSLSEPCLRCRLEPATAHLDLGFGLLLAVCETCPVQARPRARRLAP